MFKLLSSKPAFLSIKLRAKNKKPLGNILQAADNIIVIRYAGALPDLNLASIILQYMVIYQML